MSKPSIAVLTAFWLTGHSMPTLADDAALETAAAREKRLIEEAVDTAVIESSARAAKEAADETAKAMSRQEFSGISFGAGISATFDTGDNDRVNSASIVDGIVRVDDENDVVARVMLELHYFFTPDEPFFKSLYGGQGLVPANNWGFGPFIAIQPGTDDVIEALGMGMMLGFKRDEKTLNSWNIGLGWAVDPNVNILGDGFFENQPPPGSETVVRFKETSQQGLFLIFSFSF
ncbi:hypothetical protein R0137_06340 [Congregibacter brevis]|uniref:Outer membrane protein beta-barrel domain-containing protein n=1 Tax=Congregibacter brevis TaxID=3081201 RepID=A0ABZ0IF67_9GAMM|nr:hypothetical protein R0137_06340 [Congregibacter sp. IMCC45268]